MSRRRSIVTARMLGPLAFLAAATVLPGCGSGGGSARLSTRGDGGALTDAGYSYDSPSSSAGARMERYVAAYLEGRYSVAKSLAEAEMRRTTGPAADRAALIAGLAAHAQNQHSDAERLLSPLASNPDREIAGRAQACLGLIAAERKEHAKAADLLASAARRLSGNEAARAAMFAGDCLAALGRSAEARTQYSIASANASDAALKRSIADRLEIGNFTVQVGVYSSRANAQKAAMDISGAAAMLGLGEPRIVERVEAGGGRSYVVQVGRFSTRRQGTQAQARLGSGWLVSVAAGE